MRLQPIARSLIALAAMAAVCAAQAQTTSTSPSIVTVYGVLDTGVQVLDGAKSLYRVTSGGQSGSRLGFRGNEDLGGGLRALFTIESGINVDDGTNGQNAFWGRQAFVGLSSPIYGQVTLGRQYSSSFTITSDFSEFSNVSTGATTATIGGFAGGFEPIRGSTLSGTGNGGPSRVNNSVKYETPSFAGLRGGALVGLGETPGATHTRVGDFYLRYSQGPLDAVVSYLTDKSAAANLNVSLITGAASYRFGSAKVTGGWMQVDDRSAANQDGHGAWVGGEYRIANAHLLRLQYVLNKAEYGSKGRTQALGGGYQYDFSKRTDVYAMLTRFTNKGTGYADRIGGAIPAGVTDANHRNVTEFMAGVKHVF